MDLLRLTAWKGLADRARSLDLVRLGLVSATVSLTSFGFAGLIYLLEPRQQAAAVDGAEQVASARTPRPRPSEPLITGSIERAPEAQLDLASLIAAGSHPATTSHPAMDSESVENLRSEAVLTATASADCDEVAASEILAVQSSPATPVVVRVRCRNGARFYLDHERLDGAAPPSAELPAALPLSDGAAVRACEDKVRAGLPVPSSLERRAGTTGVFRARGDDPVVTFEVDAVNGLGFPLPLRVQCIFHDRRIARLHVDPRN